jgi:hypothetical protein
VLMEHHADRGLTSPCKAASVADGRRAFRCPAVCAADKRESPAASAAPAPDHGTRPTTGPCVSTASAIWC